MDVQLIKDRILENTSLTDQLDDEAANWLLDWGIRQATTLIDENTDDTAADQMADAIMAVMRGANDIAAKAAAGEATPEQIDAWQATWDTFGAANAEMLRQTPPPGADLLPQLAGLTLVEVLEQIFAPFPTPTPAETSLKPEPAKAGKKEPRSKSKKETPAPPQAKTSQAESPEAKTPLAPQPRTAIEVAAYQGGHFGEYVRGQLMKIYADTPIEFIGCSDKELSALTLHQGVVSLPMYYRELMETMGKKGIRWLFPDSECTVDDIDQLKNEMRADSYAGAFVPDDALIFFHDMGNFAFMRTATAEGNADDPPVYSFEHDKLQPGADSLSAYVYTWLTRNAALVANLDQPDPSDTTGESA